MPLAAAGETRVLNGLLTGVYVSLHTSDPGVVGSGEVPAANGYVRKACPFTNTGNNPTVASNSAAVQFNQATADWGNITHFGIWDAAAAGNLLASGAVDVSKSIMDGDIGRWDAGKLKVTAN